MAAITHNLYVKTDTGDFLDNPTGPSYGDDPLIPFNSGDLIGLSVFFFDAYNFSRSQAPLVRYPAASLTARLRAQGNNTIYATAPQIEEIVPSVAPAVTRVQAGGNFTVEKQAVVFDAFTGTFKLIFTAPTGSLSTALDAQSEYITGTTGPIKSSATADEIKLAINEAVSVFTWQGGHTTGGPFKMKDVSGAVQIAITNWTLYRGFTIEFGRQRKPGETAFGLEGTQPYVFPLPLVTLDSSGLQETYGWKIDILLDGDGHTFSDLFLAANKPAYFELVLTPSGGNPQLFQREINAAGAVPKGGGGAPPGGGPPAPPGGGGPPPAPSPGVLVNVAGIFFDGNYDSPVMIGTVSISHGIPDDSNSLIWRQKYHQRASRWSPLAIGGLGCPFNSSAIAVDETPLQWTGIGDIVEFERTWALKPNSRTRAGSYSKTYKAKFYLIVNGNADPSTYSIASRTAMIQANFVYNYYNIAAEGIPIPPIPDLAVLHNGPFHWYEAYGGFGNDNYGYVLIGADTRPYMGPIWERFLVYGQ